MLGRPGISHFAKNVREITDVDLSIKMIKDGKSEPYNIINLEGKSTVFTPEALKSPGNRVSPVGNMVETKLGRVQKLGLFVARTNEQAAGFMKVNTALSLGMSVAKESSHDK